MLCITNYTESRESFQSLALLMKTSLDMLKWQKQQGQGFITEDVLKFIRDMLEAEGATGKKTMAQILSARCQWMLQWAKGGFPRVRLDHKLAAAYMATTVSPKEIAHVRMPWPSFLVEIPSGLLHVNLGGEDFPILRVHVTEEFLPGHFGNGPNVAIEIEGPGIEMHRIGHFSDVTSQSNRKSLDARELEVMGLSRVEPRTAPLEESFWEAHDLTMEERASVLACRLVVGVCIAMTDRNQVRGKKVPFDKNLASHARRIGAEPESNVYTLGRPIRIDVREAVRDYLTGVRKSLSVQSFVTGHHKWQPHGPGGVARKWIYVEPYWRGPEDAPIVVRPHDIGKVGS